MLYVLAYTSSDAPGPRIFTTWNADELAGVDDPHAAPLIEDCAAEPGTTGVGMLVLHVDDAVLLAAIDRPM